MLVHNRAVSVEGSERAPGLPLGFRVCCQEACCMVARAPQAIQAVLLA